MIINKWYKHQYTLPFPTEQVDTIVATYKQNGSTVLTKDDFTLKNNKAICILTDDDTALFSVGNCDVTLSIVTTNGNAIESQTRTIAVTAE